MSVQFGAWTCANPQAAPAKRCVEDDGGRFPTRQMCYNDASCNPYASEDVAKPHHAERPAVHHQRKAEEQAPARLAKPAVQETCVPVQEEVLIMY